MLRTLLARLSTRAHIEITVAPLRAELPGAADLSAEATIARACSTLRALRQSLALAVADLDAAKAVGRESAGWVQRAQARATAAERDRDALQEQLAQAIATGAKNADEVLRLQRVLGEAVHSPPPRGLAECEAVHSPPPRHIVRCPHGTPGGQSCDGCDGDA